METKYSDINHLSSVDKKLQINLKVKHINFLVCCHKHSLVSRFSTCDSVGGQGFKTFLGCTSSKFLPKYLEPLFCKNGWVLLNYM